MTSKTTLLRISYGFLPMEQIPSITAQQAFRITKTGHRYTDPKMKQLSADYQNLLVPFRKKFTNEPLTGPVLVEVNFIYEGDPAEFKTTKPDCDNLAKAFLDAMQKVGFFKNDSQIVDLRIRKVYGKHTGIGFEIREL